MAQSPSTNVAIFSLNDTKRGCQLQFATTPWLAAYTRFVPLCEQRFAELTVTFTTNKHCPRHKGTILTQDNKCSSHNSETYEKTDLGWEQVFWGLVRRPDRDVEHFCTTLPRQPPCFLA